MNALVVTYPDVKAARAEPVGSFALRHRLKRTGRFPATRRKRRVWFVYQLSSHTPLFVFVTGGEEQIRHCSYLPSSSTLRLFATEKTLGTLLACISAICLSICRATTPSSVTCPLFTMM